MPGGKVGAVLRHTCGHEFIKAKTDVFDRIDGLLRPGEGDDLLFERATFQIAVRFVDKGIPPLDGITHGLCQVFPFFMEMSGQGIPGVLNAQQKSHRFEAGDRAEVLLLNKRDDLVAEKYSTVGLAQEPERFVDAECQAIEILHYLLIRRKEILLANFDDSQDVLGQ